MLSRLVHLETENSRNIALCRLWWLEMAIGHQEQMRECGAEICSINVFGSKGNHFKYQKVTQNGLIQNTNTKIDLSKSLNAV